MSGTDKRGRGHSPGQGQIFAQGDKDVKAAGGKDIQGGYVRRFGRFADFSGCTLRGAAVHQRRHFISQFLHERRIYDYGYRPL